MRSTTGARRRSWLGAKPKRTARFFDSHGLRRLGFGVPEVQDSEHDGLPRELGQHPEIELRLPERTVVYAVSSIAIVDALDTQALENTDESVITLITCHPFRYRGYAPDRYIVRAQLDDSRSTVSRDGLTGSAVMTGQSTSTTERMHR